MAEKVVKFNDDFVGSRGQVEHEGVLWMTRTWAVVASEVWNAKRHAS